MNVTNNKNDDDDHGDDDDYDNKTTIITIELIHTHTGCPIIRVTHAKQQELNNFQINNSQIGIKALSVICNV